MEERRYNRVKIILIEFNISQLELAGILKVDKNTVTRWCKNHNQPSLNQLYEIAQFFRIDIRLLIEPTTWSHEIGSSPVEVFKAERRKAKEEALAKKRKDMKKASSKESKK
jgi:putative transcriptional regulator